MQISIKTSNNVQVLTFEGKLDTQTSPDAQKRFDDVIGQGKSRIVVNFEQLDYVSSAGLRVLLAAAKQLRNAGGELRICSVNNVVKEVFDISGFGRILKVYSSEAEALESF